MTTRDIVAEREWAKQHTCGLCGGIQGHLPDCGDMARARLKLAEAKIAELQGEVEELTTSTDLGGTSPALSRGPY
jgi:hypothetical protein